MKSGGIRLPSPAETRSEYISKPFGHEHHYFNIAQLDLSNPKEVHFDQFRRRMSLITKSKKPRFYSPIYPENDTYPRARRNARKQYLDRLKKIGYEYEL